MPQPKTTNGLYNVSTQDQHTDRLSLFLGEILDTVTVLNNTLRDEETINIETTGVTPLIGDYLCLQEDLKITQLEISSVAPIAGNQYTLGLGIPLDYDYTVASGCSLMNVDMNVDGSITPVIFEVFPSNLSCWDITRMIVSMVMVDPGDDGLFGDQAKLTNGMYFRKQDSSTSQNLFIAKNNADFRIEGYDVTYVIRSDKTGLYGMASRITYAGQDKAGVTIRLEAVTNDSYRAVVRDDLTALDTFRIKVQGHIVED